MDSSLTLRFRSVSFRCRNDPNHNSSDLDWFIRNPEQLSNWSSKLNRLFSEWTSLTKTVVLSTYCVSFNVFLWSISIPFISLERLIALLRISMPITNKLPERGQPCLTPLPKLNCLVAKPLFKTQLEMSLYITLIHCRSCGPKWNQKLFRNQEKQLSREYFASL